jgi:hypothetical protein
MSPPPGDVARSTVMYGSPPRHRDEARTSSTTTRESSSAPSPGRSERSGPLARANRPAKERYLAQCQARDPRNSEGSAAHLTRPIGVGAGGAGAGHRPHVSPRRRDLDGSAFAVTLPACAERRRERGRRRR